MESRLVLRFQNNKWPPRPAHCHVSQHLRLILSILLSSEPHTLLSHQLLLLRSAQKFSFYERIYPSWSEFFQALFRTLCFKQTSWLNKESGFVFLSFWFTDRQHSTFFTRVFKVWVIPLVRQANRALGTLHQMLVRWIPTSRLPCFPLGKVPRFILPPWFFCTTHVSFQRVLTVVFTVLAVANEAVLLRDTLISDLNQNRVCCFKSYTAPFLLHERLKKESEPIELSGKDKRRFSKPVMFL